MGAAASTPSNMASQGCPVPPEERQAMEDKMDKEKIASSLAGKCPVPHEERGTSMTEDPAQRVNPFQMSAKGMKPGDALVDSERNPETPLLSSETFVSSIPKAGTSEHWVYPSDQRWYNAVKRKEEDPKWGFDPSKEDPVEEEGIPWAVYMHNALNERAWSEIMEYEKLHGGEEVDSKLESFRGRARDYTPKARMLNLFGYAPLPFDRHDWVVDRNGAKRRYIIDYYMDETEQNEPVVMLDVRPEVSFEGVVDRLRMYWKTRQQEAVLNL
ncbi:hypothetical protein SARC_02849 [Sphaeroforma arctica JP610]|uniref:Holocytochrome c-type synthase n=1 Tax=Sphaeroforma arctica JP610 TaxID=667725 RepID=A0A0L0G9L5_9EUKA|nr:hypothetical protein SARC_02849 [Sphaeroforma arctica JP610]KNC84958.1 hypothetical protein SARC_02849 [Sphaeroforma arctica JP610]|eukprot:XP_014158860.1 hypothetical protein SARC_02849 [Sphaeroforma arctica JP610]